jgi:hypothetical protein
MRDQIEKPAGRVSPADRLLSAARGSVSARPGEASAPSLGYFTVPPEPLLIDQGPKEKPERDQAQENT